MRLQGMICVIVATGCPQEERPPENQTTVDPSMSADDSDSAGESTTTTGSDDATTSGGGGGESSTTMDSNGLRYDVFGVPDQPIDPDACGAPSPVQCDDEDDDPFHAIGLNCPGGPQVEGSYNGDPLSMHVHEGEIGTYVPAPFPPREGDKILIISSGIAADLLMPGFYASSDVNGTVDNGSALPAPMSSMSVSATEDCADNPGLVGTGDCSNTIEDQWNQGSGAYDYNELRMSVVVPANTTGFSYDLAMFSTEYPNYYQSSFNDMYVAWLESESWTGNISFDEMGNPISLNAGFLDYKDAPNPYDCPAPCNAPELAGTAMMGHAGTKWLTTSAPVTPGETIELIFGVFDLSDPILDTVVILDNWLWNCDGGPPVTVPG